MEEFSEDDKKFIDEMGLNSKVESDCSKMLLQFRDALKEKAKELVWQVCNDYVEYAEYEPFSNWKDRTRDELLREQYWKKPDDYWGKVMRATILKEHKEELLPLLRTEYTEQLEKDLADYKERYSREVDFNRTYPKY